MSRAFARRLAFVVGICAILGVAVIGSVMQRRSLSDYAIARNGVSGDIARYEQRLHVGETRANAVAALRIAGAQIPAPRGDIVVTVLRELQSSSQCRSLVGQLHVMIDSTDRVVSWETPAPDAECD